MLRIFGGATIELGYYGAALNISIIPVLFLASLAQPIITLISRLLLEENYDDAGKYTLMCFRLIFWLIPFYRVTIRFIFGNYRTDFWV